MKPLESSTISDIDVVIPTYNRLWALKKSIPFYLSQREVKSVIVVNDGSTDGTRAWLGKYCKNEPRLKSITHEKNRGLPTARNTGADFSEASMIFFLMITRLLGRIMHYLFFAKSWWKIQEMSLHLFFAFQNRNHRSTLLLMYTLKTTSLCSPALWNLSIGTD